MRVSLALAAALLAGAALTPAAHAASPVATVGHVDTIPQSLGGTRVDTYDQSVIHQLDRVRKGGAVYVGIYSLSATDVTDALIRVDAARRQGLPADVEAEPRQPGRGRRSDLEPVAAAA